MRASHYRIAIDHTVYGVSIAYYNVNAPQREFFWVYFRDFFQNNRKKSAVEIIERGRLFSWARDAGTLDRQNAAEKGKNETENPISGIGRCTHNNNVALPRHTWWLYGICRPTIWVRRIRLSEHHILAVLLARARVQMVREIVPPAMTIIIIISLETSVLYENLLPAPVPPTPGSAIIHASVSGGGLSTAPRPFFLPSSRHRF